MTDRVLRNGRCAHGHRRGEAVEAQSTQETKREEKKEAHTHTHRCRYTSCLLLFVLRICCFLFFILPCLLDARVLLLLLCSAPPLPLAPLPVLSRGRPRSRSRRWWLPLSRVFCALSRLACLPVFFFGSLTPERRRQTEATTSRHKNVRRRRLNKEKRSQKVRGWARTLSGRGQAAQERVLARLCVSAERDPTPVPVPSPLSGSRTRARALVPAR